MYYSSGYKEGEKVSPTCWATDSETPDAEVKTPVSKTCSECPNSVKGSGDNGMGTKCKLSWRTAVVLPNDPAGDVMQLVLPATSAFGKEDGGRYPFRPYIQYLASNNVSAGRVITRMAFDTKFPVPKVLFSPVGPVPDEDLATKSPAAEAAIKLNVYQLDESDTTVEVSSPEVAEPVKRESDKPAASEKTADVADVVKKWSKKG
jgi:hypothetical protein